MKKKLSNPVVIIVLAVSCVSFFVASISLFSQEGVGAGVTGILLSAVCGYFGYTGFVAMKSAPASEAKRPVIPNTGESVFLKKSYEQVGECFADNEYTKHSFKVVGVTFKNDDGSSRQDTLRKIDMSEPPYDDFFTVSVKEYPFNDTNAVGVFAENTQIGNISSDEKEDILALMRSRKDFAIELSVYGGQGNKNFGAKITYWVEI